MSGSVNSTAGRVLGASTTVGATSVLANTGSANTWLLITASVSFAMSISVIALKLAAATRK